MSQADSALLCFWRSRTQPSDGAQTFDLSEQTLTPTPERSCGRVRRGRERHGFQDCRPRKLPAKVRARIKRRRAAGKSLGAIADELNRDEVPTAHGGARWYASTVRAVLAAD